MSEVRQQVIETNTTSSESPAPSQQEAASTPPSTEGPNSKRLADLARRERQRVEAETRFKQERESWENTRKQHDPILDAIQKFKSTKDADAAFKLLEASGISYEELTDRILANSAIEQEETSTPTAFTLEDIEKIAEKRVQALLEQKEQERLSATQEQEDQQAIEQFKKSIEQEAEREGTDYRFIKKTEGGYDLVFDLVVQYYEQNQEILPLETAFKEVEQQLKSDYNKLKALYEAENSVSKPQESTFIEREIMTQRTPNAFDERQSRSSTTTKNEDLDRDEKLRRVIDQLRRS